MRTPDLSPSIKWAGGADSASCSIEKVAERVRNSTLKLFPISCTVNAYCRAAARGSRASRRSLSVLLEANQKWTERENKRGKSMQTKCERVLKRPDQGVAFGGRCDFQKRSTALQHRIKCDTIWVQILLFKKKIHKWYKIIKRLWWQNKSEFVSVQTSPLL